MLIKEELYERFDNFLIDINPNDVTIHSGCSTLVYNITEVLKIVDPIAYNESFNNWLDFQIESKVIFTKDGNYYNEDPNLEFTLLTYITIDEIRENLISDNPDLAKLSISLKDFNDKIEWCIVHQLTYDEIAIHFSHMLIDFNNNHVK
jgi:hypothetical protein